MSGLGPLAGCPTCGATALRLTVESDGARRVVCAAPAPCGWSAPLSPAAAAALVAERDAIHDGLNRRLVALGSPAAARPTAA